MAKLTQGHKPPTSGMLWPEMSVKQHQQIKVYLRELADQLGLRDWLIELSNQPCNTGDCIAHVEVVYGRKLAVVSLSRHFSDEEPWKKRLVLTHELMHCHIDFLDSVIQNGLEQLIGKPAQILMQENFDERKELVVDALSMEFAKFMPQFPKREE